MLLQVRYSGEAKRSRRRMIVGVDPEKIAQENTKLH